MKRFLTAKEAAEELGISVATLYAYVSRGLVRSEAAGGKSRARHYNGADIAALKRKQSYRHKPDKVAQNALQRGMPVLDSAITLIEEGALTYRGYDALDLAVSRRFEEVCTLLWTKSFAVGDLFAMQNRLSLDKPSFAVPLAPIDLFQVALPLAAAVDHRAYDFAPDRLHQTGARLLCYLTELVVDRRDFGSIAEALQRIWVPENCDAVRPIEAALILCADHELNVSAFTGRCVASAGSTLYQVVQGGLAALRGFRHGGHTERVAALLNQIEDDVERKLIAFIRRGEALSGFSHPLYPNGDPRGRLLLELAEKHAQNEAELALTRQIQELVWQNLERYPTIDFGLVTMSRALNLPSDAPLTLFALGRTAGWIAHALEQYEAGQLIRPRARYVGERRVTSDERRATNKE